MGKSQYSNEIQLISEIDREVHLLYLSEEGTKCLNHWIALNVCRRALRIPLAYKEYLCI